MKKAATDPNAKHPTQEPERDCGLNKEENRTKFIAEAAYYKSEKRGFEPGYEEQDWMEAEREIGELLTEYGE
jgi:hypothetical protein